MINVKMAYAEAKKLSEAPHIRQILSFDNAFGFIFSQSRTEPTIGGLCILISKEESKDAVLLPLIFENLDFLGTGKDLPLTVIK